MGATTKAKLAGFRVTDPVFPQCTVDFLGLKKIKRVVKYDYFTKWQFCTSYFSPDQTLFTNNVSSKMDPPNKILRHCTTVFLYYTHTHSIEFILKSSRFKVTVVEAKL